jgi:hypothetical protein
MLSAALATLLTAAPSLALPSLSAVGLEPGEADLYANLLATGLRSRGLKVVSGDDIAAVLGLERQKQLMGCAESCMAELAAALGAEGVVLGRVGLLGRGYTLTARVISAANAETLADASETAPGAPAMPATLEHLAWRLAQQLATRFPAGGIAAGPEPAPWQPQLATLRKWSLLPVAIGVVSIGVGVALRFKASSTLEALQQAQSLEAAALLRDAGKTEQAVGLTLLGVGGASAIAAIVMLFVAPSDPAVVAAVAPLQGGAWAGLTWRLP